MLSSDRALDLENAGRSVRFYCLVPEKAGFWMSEPESLAIEEGLNRHVARHALDRLVMLSDGVFAIAITLAALEIHVPSAPTFTAVFAAMTVPLFAYFVSFTVIAMFWISNRDMFARVRRVDRPLTILVLATLCVTALIPASVRITGPGQGALGGAFQFYALIMALSGTLNCLLWVYASLQTGIMSPQIPRSYRIRRVAETATLPLLFIVIFILPTVTMLKWIAVSAIAIVAVRRILVVVIKKHEIVHAQRASTVKSSSEIA